MWRLRGIRVHRRSPGCGRCLRVRRRRRWRRGLGRGPDRLIARGESGRLRSRRLETRGGCMHGVAGGSRNIGTVRPRVTESHPFPDVVQIERVRQRQTVAASLRCVVRLDGHVKDPAEDKQHKDARDVRKHDQHGEDNQVDQPFGVLLVVHGPDSGNQPEQRGEAGIGLSGCGRHRGSHPRIGYAGVYRNVTGLGACGTGGTGRCTGQARSQAGLAVNRWADFPHGLAVEALAAILAKRHSLRFLGCFSLVVVIHAVHARPPSCIAATNCSAAGGEPPKLRKKRWPLRENRGSSGFFRCYRCCDSGKAFASALASRRSSTRDSMTFTTRRLS